MSLARSTRVEERDEFDRDEFDMERARRSDFDNPERRNRNKQPNWLAIAVAVLSIVTQLATFFWYGGRLSQRVDTLEALQLEARQRDVTLGDENGKQNVTLGIIGQQYGDISRRLESIEHKLDQR